MKPLITEIKLDIDAIKPEYGGHLERYYQIIVGQYDLLSLSLLLCHWKQSSNTHQSL